MWEELSRQSYSKCMCKGPLSGEAMMRASATHDHGKSNEITWDLGERRGGRKERRSRDVDWMEEAGHWQKRNSLSRGNDMIRFALCIDRFGCRVWDGRHVVQADVARSFRPLVLYSDISRNGRIWSSWQMWYLWGKMGRTWSVIQGASQG